ncbi:hypothetical protein ACH42_07720 [Endozoicomonas sp. (ex Bugula neritina AB1)]|nr:hypothetical protein ACH42_07720 [Endozoicomonas sp. (ex Bugula neritina AB1)]
MKNILLFLLIILPLEVVANAVDATRIIGHNRLQQAIRFNTPPSGYIDLSYCESVKSIGNIDIDRKTYRLSFADNFTFNPDTGELSTIIETAMLHTKMIGKTPILAKIPITAIVSSAPQSPYLRYQIVSSSNQRTSMRMYMCGWDKAVYLWR